MARLDRVGDRRSGAMWPHAASAQQACVGELPSFLAARAGAVPAGNDNLRHLCDRGPAYELDCLRHVLAPDLLQRAERRAGHLGIGADQVLIQWGMIDDTAYLRHLSQHTGIAIDELLDVDRSDLLLRDGQIAAAAASGMVQLRRDGRLVLAIAPRNLTARSICRAVAADPALTRSMRLTSEAALRRLLLQQGGAALARSAARGVSDSYSSMSAAPGLDDRVWRGRLKRGAAVGAVALLPPLMIPAAWWTLLALCFLGFVMLRLVACCWPRPRRLPMARLPDDRLPIYTTIAPLFREADCVAPLMRVIDALDYPHEKLDVILVVEPDDPATLAAIAQLGPRPHLRVLVAPAVAPQTKPKALNWALPFARGSFIAVFDAEDLPETGQLRAALDAFRSSDARVACAQASLCIDNETHSWLSRTFAVEYAGQFDAVLPGLSAMGLPLPLGGSSNHFRTSVLRSVRGWDAFNVTEDADLDFRLARFGHRSVTFDSTTFEEAPIHFRAWRRQRSRWMKGWLQTWCVHMRHPRRLWGDAGPGGFFALNMIAGGNVLTALAYPAMVLGMAMRALGHFSGSPPAVPAALYALVIAATCLSTIAVGLIGTGRRGRRRDLWILAMTPLYWGCLSVAAWRAVAQFVWVPYRWEKTEHGVVRRTGSAPASPAPLQHDASVQR
ncbi:glycosyltransferase [Rhodopseudomonas sp. RCAM05734]|uniref:glycosyltransferase n=1 Tax=Rhodopseudomonas sp. RCAM05734 TaxID=3457549 RepID=UPI004043C9CA